MAFWFKTSKLRPYKACKSLADTPISQKLANILTGLAYLQGAPICTTEIHSAESGWLVGTTCVYLSFTLKKKSWFLAKLFLSYCHVSFAAYEWGDCQLVCGHWWYPVIVLCAFVNYLSYCGGRLVFLFIYSLPLFGCLSRHWASHLVVESHQCMPTAYH